MKVKFKDTTIKGQDAKEYTVYAIEISSGECSLFIHSDPETPIPYEHNITLLDIVDAEVPLEWITNDVEYSSGQKAVKIAYPEWANDVNYYWHLSDGDEKKLAIHNSYRKTYEKR